MVTATDIVLLAAMVLAAVATVATARLMRSVIGLAVTSAVLTVFMFRMEAPYAAVFELSVCAGLIPAIFLSTIGLTQRLTPEGLEARRRDKWRRFWLLPIILVLIVIAASQMHPAPELPALPARVADVRAVMWYERHLDLLAQVVILLAGAFGIVVLIKEAKRG
jgi:NADH-quinone oxidoreductase subunit J